MYIHLDNLKIKEFYMEIMYSYHFITS